MRNYPTSITSPLVGAGLLPRPWQVLLLVLALLLGTVFWFLPLPYFQLDYDGGVYALLGRNWAEGKGFTLGGYPNSVYAPLYPAVFALLSRLPVDLETSGLGFSLLCWWTTIGVFYLLAREFWEDVTAILATLLLSTHGFIISIFTRFLADVLFIPLLLTSLWLCIKLGRQHKTFGTYFLWALSGLALTLTKTEGVYFFLLQFFFLAVFSPLPRKKRLGVLSLALALFLLGLFPYWQFMKEATGRYQLSRKLSINLAMTRRSSNEDWQIYNRTNFALNPDQKTVPYYNGPDKNPWQTIKENFPQLVRNYAANLTYAVKTLAGVLHLSGLLLLAAFFYRVKKDPGARRAGLLLLVGLTLLAGAGHLFFLYERRVLVQYFVLITLFLGGGLGYIYPTGAERYPQRKIWAGLLVGLLLLSWMGISQQQVYSRARGADSALDFQRQKAAGYLLKKTMPSLAQEKLVALKPTVSFYAGADFLHLPFVDKEEDLHQYMINNNAKFLVISPREVAEKRPALFHLAQGKDRGPWRLVAALEGKAATRGVYIYQLSESHRD